MVENASLKRGVFTIFSGLKGAPTLRVTLNVATDGKVAGVGEYSQPVFPPVLIQNPFSGEVHTTGLGSTEQIFALKGSEPGGRRGGSYVSSLLIDLDGTWAEIGKASYELFTDSPEGKSFKDVQTTVAWL